MINIFASVRNSHTVKSLLKAPDHVSGSIRLLNYQSVFSRLVVPAGTLVFTDFDHLQTYEIDAVTEMAKAARLYDPNTIVLNDPADICERYLLLKRLNKAGLNPVEIVRLEDDIMPTRFPVFIRSEDGSAGVESGLLDSVGELKAEIMAIRQRGRTLKRRVAISFEGCRDANGYYRKYGAFVIGDRIIPQHILRSDDWVVKKSGTEMDPDFIREQLAFIRDNPHAEFLAKVAKIGGIGFGRIDYTIVDDKPVVFEINTNPAFPRLYGEFAPERKERRDLLLSLIGDALQAIDRSQSGKVRFSLQEVKSKFHIERIPLQTKPAAPPSVKPAAPPSIMTRLEKNLRKRARVLRRRAVWLGRIARQALTRNV